MALTQHTVAIQQVQAILAGARARGLPVQPLLQRAGIPQALMDAPLARVSLGQYAGLIRALRRALRDELWGMTARPLPVGSFGQCVQRLVHCRTLGEAWREGLAFHHLVIDDFVGHLGVDAAEGVARVRIHPRRAADDRLDFAQKAFLLFASGLASWLVARRVPLLWVDYTRPPLGADTPRMYQAPVRYDQARIGLAFEARWLELPVVQTAPAVREFLARAPENLLIRYRDTGRLAERIRRVLRRRLDGALPSLESVSEVLGLAPQTVRRRLRDEGHGFQQLKDELRRDAAIELLGQPELSLADAALQLGFSDASTFHRAFKKWTGVAPGEYRQKRLRPG